LRRRGADAAARFAPAPCRAGCGCPTSCHNEDAGIGLTLLMQCMLRVGSSCIFSTRGSQPYNASKRQRCCALLYSYEHRRRPGICECRSTEIALAPNRHTPTSCDPGTRQAGKRTTTAHDDPPRLCARGGRSGVRRPPAAVASSLTVRVVTQDPQQGKPHLPFLVQYLYYPRKASVALRRNESHLSFRSYFTR
jgi:hypothetical protein